MARQLPRLPADATHLFVSVGGNDALGEMGILQMPASSAEEVFNELSNAAARFENRYKRMLDEGENLPQLILIDGGKGQLSSAVKSLKLLGLYGKITIVGIAKRLEEIFFPEDPIPLYLDKKSETLKILQRVRDEAHRFGVKHHRTRRTNNTIKSELEEIPGVGEKTIELLLKKLKSVKRVKEANLETLEEILGKQKGKIVWEFFNQ